MEQSNKAELTGRKGGSLIGTGLVLPSHAHHHRLTGRVASASGLWAAARKVSFLRMRA